MSTETPTSGSRTREWKGLRLGHGVELVDADHLRELFQPTGWTRDGFRRFLEEMGLGVIVMPDGTELVDRLEFNLCVKAIVRFGSGLRYYCPGAECPSHQRLNAEAFRANFERARGDIIEHTLFSVKQHRMREEPGELRAALENAADRIQRGFARVLEEEVEAARLEGEKLRREMRRRVEGEVEREMADAAQE